MATKGANPAETLHRLLEIRLDNVAYRIGLAPTRRAARQMVSHGHLTINGVKTTIPSRRMRVGDQVAVREGSKGATLFATFAEKFAERPLPSWLAFDAKSMKGSVTGVPPVDSGDAAGDLVAVLSFYSR